MRWDADIFPGEKQIDKNYYTLSSQQNLTFFIWNTNKTSHHEHKNYYEIFVMLKGKCNHLLNGKQSIIRAGDAVLIQPNMPHQLLPFDDNTECKYVNITCIDKNFPLLLSALSDANHELIQAQTIRLNEQTLNAVNSYIEQIINSQHKQNDHLILSSFFTYLLSIFLFTITNNTQQDVASTQHPAWLKKFLFKLSEIPLEDLQICELYKLSSYSQSAFSIQFKKYMNMTLVQYINQLKLDYACALLSKTDFSLLYITQKIGFVNLGHFDRLFKKKYGMTPSAYRKVSQFK